MSSLPLSDLYKQHVEEDKPTYLPPGEYELEVVGASHKTTSGGFPSVFPIYRVYSGELKGRKVLAGNIALNENNPGSVSVFFQNLDGFGLGEGFWNRQPTPSWEELAKAFVGRVVRVTIETNRYNDEDRNQITVGKIKLLGIKDGAGVLQPVGGTTATPPAAPAAPAAPPATPPSPPAGPPESPPAPPAPADEQPPTPDTAESVQADQTAPPVPEPAPASAPAPPTEPAPF